MALVKILSKRKRITLVAHDHKKADLMEWAVYNNTSLAKHVFMHGEYKATLPDYTHYLNREIKEDE